MIVREARAADVEAVIALGKEMHGRSRRAHIAFDADGARDAMAKAGLRKGAAAFVAEHQGRVVGLVVVLEQKWLYLKGRYASDVVFFASHPGAGRKLLLRMIAWASERGVDEVLSGVTFGGKSAKGTVGLYTRIGFEQRGGMFAMNLRNTPCRT